MITSGRTLAEHLGSAVGERFVADPSWTNSWGAVFGGLTVAVLLDRWSRGLPPGQGLRGVHLAFRRAATSASPLTIQGQLSPGRTITRLTGSIVQDGRTVLDGFAIATRSSGATTARPRRDPRIPAPGELGEASGDGHTAAFIRHHFEMRVVPRLDGEPVLRQWIRLRHFQPAEDGRHPQSVIGLLADLATVGVFRTAAMALDAVQAVTSLDLGLHLTTASPGTWTLMTVAVPPIHEGEAVASARFEDEAGVLLATVNQAALVRPLDHSRTP